MQPHAIAPRNDVFLVHLKKKKMEQTSFKKFQFCLIRVHKLFLENVSPAFKFFLNIFFYQQCFLPLNLLLDARFIQSVSCG